MIGKENNNAKGYITILASQWETMKDNLSGEQIIRMIDAFFATMNDETPNLDDDKVNLLYSAWEYGLKQQAKRRKIAKQQGEHGIKGKEYGILGKEYGKLGGRPRKNENKEIPTMANAQKQSTMKETKTTTPTDVRDAIDRLIMPMVSYDYHEIKDRNMKIVKKWFPQWLKDNEYFKEKCREVMKNPIPLTQEWGGLANNHRLAHRDDPITKATRYILMFCKDKKVKAAASW